MRKLSDLERNAFVKMIELIGDEVARDQAIKDIDKGYVEELDDKHILAFHIPNYSRPKYQGQHALMSKDNLTIDGVVPDALGDDVYVWPFADHNNRILEVELNNFTETILFPLDWNNFRLA